MGGEKDGSSRFKWLRRLFRSGRIVVVTVFLGSVYSQDLSFTVQVAAVSDRDSALALQRELVLEGYPGYVIRSEAVQGIFYRVRVGAFANRAAAAEYAAAMPEFGGGESVPALAEAVPLGVMPLEPRLIATFDNRSLELHLLRWKDSIAIKHEWMGGSAGVTYLLVEGGEVTNAPLFERGALSLEPPLFVFPASVSGLPEAVGGVEWQVVADGSFGRMTLRETDRFWRATVGTPLWSDGQFLLSLTDEALLLYDFVMR